METKDNKAKQWFRRAVLGLACANFFIWLAIADAAARGDVEVWFFDIGQGDAAFIQSPEGVQIIIDGGPGQAILEKLPKAMPFYDRQIDWMILSHPDSDHLAGLLAVLQNYQVDNIIWSGIGKDTSECRKWEELIAAEGANIFEVLAGDKFNLGRSDLSVEILSPESGDENSAKDSNNLSVAARVVYGDFSSLFAGDIDSKEEQKILDKNPGLRAGVLKIAHHGSKYSANDEFAAGLMAAAAVISCGENNAYGHPHQEVLDLLEKYDIKTLRTDINGDIVFRTDGERIFVRTQK